TCRQASAVLDAVQDASRRRSRCRKSGILDSLCARRSAGGQVGTKGWSLAVEQRDGTKERKEERKEERKSGMISNFVLDNQQPHTRGHSRPASRNSIRSERIVNGATVLQSGCRGAASATRDCARRHLAQRGSRHQYSKVRRTFRA